MSLARPFKSKTDPRWPRHIHLRYSYTIYAKHSELKRMATPTRNDFKNPIAVAKTVLSAATSLMATVMVVRSVVRPFVPPEFQDFFSSRIRGFLSRFYNEMTMVIEQYDGYAQNELFEAAQVFLAAKQSAFLRRVKVTKSTKENHSTQPIIDRNQVLVDTFNGVKLKWVLRQVDSGYGVHQGRSPTVRPEAQYFELTFDEKHMEIVDKSYLPFVMDEAKSIKQGKKTLKLYTLGSDGRSPGPWSPVNLNHPATFQTLAMDLELKKKILDDLDRFVRKEHYRRVGKVWKRGYLLYGPPGTGKSSLVAAMANYLNFDIYDLELSGRCNAELRRLLVATTNQSILVVEDIDCTVELQDRKSETQAASLKLMLMGYQPQDRVTLSGFLNFIDGLWSSCGDERIIIFTTNHIEKLDPALLRPGCMDLHIPMSYCTPCGFKLLAFNYLGIDRHELFDHIESLLETARVTSGEVAEQLLKSDEPETSLRDMVTFLINHKRKVNEEVIQEKVCRSQLIVEIGGSEEQSSESKLIEK
ncbi:hypothetical protein BT93_J1674 [Corymbia citriodora subsp. variegata]|nr:hypothetical protein BT93_J1674 [Corymbia citriodora subsp. variegata]